MDRGTAERLIALYERLGELLNWLCEYWEGDTWRLLDAELDNEAIAKEYALDFPPWDVPRDRFLTAGEAWRALRRGTIDGETCGVSFIPAITGPWFVGASILRDLAALTAGPAPEWQGLRAIYQAADDLRVPPTVLSFPGGKPIEVPV